MYKHVTNDHAGEEDLVDFEMAMTSSFKKPISRIINEGVRIKNKPENTGTLSVSFQARVRIVGEMPTASFAALTTRRWLCSRT